MGGDHRKTHDCYLAHVTTIKYLEANIYLYLQIVGTEMIWQGKDQLCWHFVFHNSAWQWVVLLSVFLSQAGSCLHISSEQQLKKVNTHCNIEELIPYNEDIKPLMALSRVPTTVPRSAGTPCTKTGWTLGPMAIQATTPKIQLMIQAQSKI